MKYNKRILTIVGQCTMENNGKHGSKVKEKYHMSMQSKFPKATVHGYSGVWPLRYPFICNETSHSWVSHIHHISPESVFLCFVLHTSHSSRVSSHVFCSPYITYLQSQFSCVLFSIHHIAPESVLMCFVLHTSHISRVGCPVCCTPYITLLQS